jgi:hypothetical protein
MSHRIVVFAGAGASYGVSSKYPMTQQFFDKLPDSVKSSSTVFNFVTAFAQQQNGKVSIDIEDVLWVLGDMLGALSSSTKKGSVLQHLLAKNQVHAVTKMNPQGPEILTQFNELQKQATTLRNAIHDEVYRYYNVLPTEEELNGTWVPLLKWLRSLSSDSVDIFTTNYDLVIESALEGVEGLNIQTGRQVKVVEVKLDTSLWDRGKVIDGGLLTKLHGSVDWQNAGTDASGRPIIRWGHLEKHGSHDTRGIIYPGFKGAPDAEPFKSFHGSVRISVCEALD